jgi:hypothetical protein
MKQVFFFILAFLIFSCNGNKNQNQTKNPEDSKEGVTEFVVNEEIHNFGKLNAGEIVIFSFILKNTGQKNLVIKNIESDCGCINVHSKNEPVAPDGEKVIEVEFDTSGLFEKQYKSIRLEVNTKEKIKYLAIVAEVKNEILEINN